MFSLKSVQIAFVRSLRSVAVSGFSKGSPNSLIHSRWRQPNGHPWYVFTSSCKNSTMLRNCLEKHGCLAEVIFPILSQRKTTFMLSAQVNMHPLYSPSHHVPRDLWFLFFCCLLVVCCVCFLVLQSLLPPSLCLFLVCRLFVCLLGLVCMFVFQFFFVCSPLDGGGPQSRAGGQGRRCSTCTDGASTNTGLPAHRAPSLTLLPPFVLFRPFSSFLFLLLFVLLFHAACVLVFLCCVFVLAWLVFALLFLLVSCFC